MIKWANYNKKTPKNWRNLGDFCLVMIPVVMATAPNLPIPQVDQTWIMQGGSILLVAIKFWTKNKVEETAEDDTKK